MAGMSAGDTGVAIDTEFEALQRKVAQKKASETNSPHARIDQQLAEKSDKEMAQDIF